MKDTETDPPGINGFEDEAAIVLQRLRGALAAVVAAIPPGDVAKAAHLQRSLGIDKKLSWKLFKVIEARQPLTAGPHVPGSANLRTFLRAAQKHGVPKPVIAAAARAGQEFEHVVAAHAGDRAAFDSMVSSVADAEGEQVTVQHRRDAFRANRHIWGVQARTHLYCVMVQPADDSPDNLAIAVIQAYRDLRRLRPSAPLIVGRVSLTDDTGALWNVQRQPLDPAGATEHGIALVPQFCSPTLPSLRTVQAADGVVYCELVSDGLGKRAAFTLTHAHVMPKVMPRFAAPGHEVFGTTIGVRIPCEVLISDLIIRRDTYGAIEPRLRVFGERSHDLPRAALPPHCDLLPFSETVTRIGHGAAALHSTDMPHYPKLVRSAFERLGWAGEQFDIYRCRIEYPVMPSTVVVECGLPASPVASGPAGIS